MGAFWAPQLVPHPFFFFLLAGHEICFPTASPLRFTLTITVQVWCSEFTAAFMHYFAETFSRASIPLFQSTQNNLFNSLCWKAKHILHVLIRIHFIQSVANTGKCAIHLVMYKSTLQIICMRSGEFLKWISFLKMWGLPFLWLTIIASLFKLVILSSNVAVEPIS